VPSVLVLQLGTQHVASIELVLRSELSWAGSGTGHGAESLGPGRDRDHDHSHSSDVLHTLEPCGASSACEELEWPVQILVPGARKWGSWPFACRCGTPVLATSRTSIHAAR